MGLEYSSSLNGASYLFFELKQAAKLKIDGFTDQEIRRKVKEENVFQFENTGRISRTLPSIMKRLAIIDETLASLMIEGTITTGKVINLYAIMKTDLLFYEFMREVISEKLRSGTLLLEQKDLNLFFTEKEEQSNIVANWSEINKTKLKRAYMQVLSETGLLKRKTGELGRLIIEEQLKEYCTQIGDIEYIRAMGE